MENAGAGEEDDVGEAGVVEIPTVIISFLIVVTGGDEEVSEKGGSKCHSPPRMNTAGLSIVSDSSASTLESIICEDISDLLRLRLTLAKRIGSDYGVYKLIVVRKHIGQICAGIVVREHEDDALVGITALEYGNLSDVASTTVGLGGVPNVSDIIGDEGVRESEAFLRVLECGRWHCAHARQYVYFGSVRTSYYVGESIPGRRIVWRIAADRVLARLHDRCMEGRFLGCLI